MPRSSNPTEYDNFMSVFKQDGSSRHRHARPSQQASGTHHGMVPRAQTPHPSQATPSATSGYSGYQDQTSTGGVSSLGWEEPSYRGAQGPAYTGSAIPPYGSSAALMPPATSQWAVHFSYNGRVRRQVLPIRIYEVPQLQCECGTHIRIVHLPTLVNWQPPFGVLWNFKANDKSGWFEGDGANTCVSATQCPVCKTYISLHGPHTATTG